MVEFLGQTHFFEFMEERYLRWLADQALVTTAAAGETLFREGRVAEHLYLIVDGRIGFAYGEEFEEAQVFLRTISGTGEPLGWSALVDPRRYHDTCVVLEPARLVALPSLPLERLCEEHPAFGIALFKRVLQLIGARLRSIRVGLVVRRYAKETLAVRALLDQAAESLHVSSALHKIPYLLENRLTLSDAFHVLELTRSHGNSLERHLAALSLDLLQDVHRELDFYRGLQAAYETVANAPKNLTAEDVRKWCMEVFLRVFETTSHRIRGEENLPDRPGCILIMNHLENHPDTQLPNDFRLTLDTHFVSSMILYRHYDDAPIRIIRKPPLGWYGHQQYFDRLDYIYVYGGEMDEEDRDQQLTQHDRISSFIERAGAHLKSGRNIVIAPEGACRHTENSPGPFKAGAFRLAASVEPEPLIIPVAVANFDKKITHTTTATIVYPPFRLSDRVSDPNDRDALAVFLAELHREYRGYVREAIELTQA
jgi:CRP-like cAMP-binding protein/1-acyl-sn-glycerol-3-phosphate acyltransferase